VADVPERDGQRSELTRPAGAPSPLRIGELLRRHGLIDHDALALALAEQELTSNSPPLGRVLLRLGAIDEATLTAILAEQFGMRVVDLGREASPDPSALARITREAAHRLRALPLRYEDGQLIVVVAEPPTRETQREILKLSGRQPVYVLARTETLSSAIDCWFPHPSTVVDPLGDGADPTLDVEPLRDRVLSRPSSPAQSPIDGPINVDAPDRKVSLGSVADGVTGGVRVDDRVVGWLLTHAGGLGATSVHLLEEPSTLRVRVRVDRKMRETTVLPTAAGTILVRRVLAASGMDFESLTTQRGSIPAVPGSRDEWQVRSQPQPSGRVVILRPTTPAT
jgi:hypothetical protein